MSRTEGETSIATVRFNQQGQTVWTFGYFETIDGYKRCPYCPYACARVPSLRFHFMREHIQLIPNQDQWGEAETAPERLFRDLTLEHEDQENQVPDQSN